MTYFTEQERKALDILILKMVMCDKRFSHQELEVMRKIRERYDLPYQPEDNEMSYRQAIQIFRQMTAFKKEEVRQLLLDLSDTDLNLTETNERKLKDDDKEKKHKQEKKLEQNFIEMLFQEVSLREKLNEKKEELMEVFDVKGIQASMKSKEKDTILKRIPKETPAKLVSLLHKYLLEIYPLWSVQETIPEGLLTPLSMDKETTDEIKKRFDLADHISLLEKISKSNYLEVDAYVEYVREIAEDLLTRQIKLFLQSVE